MRPGFSPRSGQRAGGSAFAVLALLGAGCGDVSGVPIVATQSSGDVSVDPPPAISTDLPPPKLGPTPGASPGDGGELAIGPVLGLCERCRLDTECGDGTDYCLTYRGNNSESFCTRDCTEDGGCPIGYRCVDLANSSARQCAPETTNCQHRSSIPAAPNLAELRAAALLELNQARQSSGLPALAVSECLQDIAQSSSAELSQSSVAGAKYQRECAPFFPECACGWSAEYQITVAEYGLVWSTALTRAVGQGLVALDGDGEPVLAATRYGRVGIGILLGGDEAWITFALAN